MKWEYNVIVWHPPSDPTEPSLQEGLDAAGEAGWELAAATESGTSLTLFFKRPAA